MNRVCTLLAGLALLCGASGALKPGFTYHGNLRPSDQVLTNYEGFVGATVTNVLDAMDLTPTQITNTEVVVSNVTVYTTEEHWVTNNVMDEYRTIVITNTILTNVYHEVTNNVVNNFVQNFEHWHTNYTHEVTNVYHYEVLEFTNVVREIVARTNNIYEVTNIVTHTDHYHSVTNEFYDNYYITNHVVDVISNLHVHTWHDTYHTNYTTNVTTQYIDVVTNTVHHDSLVYTNAVEVDFVPYTNTVYEVTNLVEHTWHTNYTTNVETQYIDTVISNFVEHTWHTNWEETVIYERTNYTVNVTTQVDRVIHETNVTVDVVNLTTNSYSYSYEYNLGDRIVFTNGMETYRIDANNKKYTRFRRDAETLSGYFQSETLGHYYGTNVLLNPISAGTAFYYPPLLRMYDQDSPDVFRCVQLSNGTSADMRAEGVIFPVIDASSIQDGSYYVWLALRLTGGYTGVGAGNTTNYITSTSFPAIGDWLFFSTYGYTENSYPPSGVYKWYKASGTPSTFGTFLANDQPIDTDGHYVYTLHGNQFYPMTCLLGSNKGWLISGKTGTAYPGIASSDYTTIAKQFRFAYSTTPVTFPLDSWSVDDVQSLVGYDELRDYVSEYAAVHVAQDVVTNDTFTAMVTEAMMPYTFMSATNAANAAASAYAAAQSASSLSNFQSSAEAYLDSAVATATANAQAAATTAGSYYSGCQNAANSASSAQSAAQQAAQSAQDQYIKIVGFTNWFYAAVNDGRVITNQYYTYEYGTPTTDPEGIASVDASTGLVTVKASELFYTVPLQLTETGYGGQASGYANPNGTYSFAGIVRGTVSWISSTASYQDTVQILYRNDAASSTSSYEVDYNGLKIYYSGLTFIWNKAESKWRLVRHRYSSSGTYYWYWWDAGAYSANLVQIWSTDGLGTNDKSSGAPSTIVFTPTSYSLYTGDGKNSATVDLVTEAELAASNFVTHAELPNTSDLAKKSEVGASFDGTAEQCSYSVYFDTAGTVQGTFTIRTSDYSTASDGTRTYEITNLSGGPGTSSSYGQLASVVYTWNPTSGALSVTLTGSSSGNARTYTATQTGSPIANYYGTQWSLLKTSQTSYWYFDRKIERLISLSSYINGRFDDIAAWLAGTRLSLTVTKYRQSSTLSKSVTAASTDSPMGTGSTVRKIAAAENIATGLAAGSYPGKQTVTSMTIDGFDAASSSSSAYIRLRLLVKYDGGASENLWLNTGMTAANLFSSSSVTTKSWTGSTTQNLYSSATGTGYVGYPYFNGTLTISPRGTY